MKTFLGVLLIIAGLALAAYVGVWLCFIGGIVQVVEAVKATPVSGLDIALGALRICGAGVAGVLTAVVAVFPGFAMVTAD
jgi:hypothetical protein